MTGTHVLLLNQLGFFDQSYRGLVFAAFADARFCLQCLACLGFLLIWMDDQVRFCIASLLFPLTEAMGRAILTTTLSMCQYNCFKSPSGYLRARRYKKGFQSFFFDLRPVISRYRGCSYLLDISCGVAPLTVHSASEWDKERFDIHWTTPIDGQLVSGGQRLIATMFSVFESLSLSPD